MFSNHRGLRLAVFTTVCALLTLATVATVAAYPITPEGEPLHLEAGATPALPGTAVATSVVGRSNPAAPAPVNAVPVEEISSQDTAWGDEALAAMAALAVLVLVVAALRLAGSRRGSVTGRFGRERS